ncbi:MAG: Ig-like domain-containing protein [Thiotrichaceae bacterium]|nr:Ig-like domain-containing protein [Thiotrichaceae bacterium]
MLAKKVFKWLALAMMLSILAACGGGGGETSNLLSDSGDNGSTPIVDTTDPTDVTFFISSTQVIPTAGSSIVTVTVFEANPDATITDTDGSISPDITQLIPENNVTFRASVTDEAYFLENGKNYLDIESDQRGQVSFTVAHPGNGKVLLSVKGQVNYQGGSSDYLYFGGSVVAEAANNNTQISADGSSSAQIIVSARDAFLSPIPGLSVDLSFSPDSQATANSDTAFVTDANGQFRANISNSVEQAVSVIPYAGGGRGNTIKLSFTKAAESTAVVSATLVTQGIIPADGETPAKVIVLARSTDGVPLSNLPVSLSFPADSFAVASPSTGSTDENGQFITNITNYVTQTTEVTPIVAGISADPITLNFGTTAQESSDIVVTATLLTQGLIPANGTTTAKLLVLARDLDGIPVEGLPVALAFPKNSFAVATTSIGTTDANGQFSSEISDSVPETVSITAIVGGTSSNAVEIEFIASGGGEAPTELDIKVSDSNAIANGSDKVQVVVVARDELGNVVPNIPVKLSGGSATSVMRVANSSNVGTLYVSGNTGEQGLSVTITNSIAETLTLNAAAVVNGTEVSSQEQAVIFTEIQLPTEQEQDNIATVTLEALVTEQVADGQSSITLSGQALTQSGAAVANASVSFEKRGDAKISIDNNAKTYADGRFFATITDENVESFSIRAIVDGVSSLPVVLTFTGQTDSDGSDGSDGSTVTPATPPSSINIIPSPRSQLADGESTISLTVVVLDSNRTPMEGVEVTLSPTSGTVSNTTLFDKAKETTGASGSATFSVTNTQVGTVTVTAKAQGIDSSGSASGTAASSRINLTFITPIQAAKLTLVSTPSSAAADGVSTISVDVIARDRNGVTIAGVPINMILGDDTARANPSTGTTDANGIFTTQITSNQVGTLGITAQVKDINVSENLNLQFTSLIQDTKLTLISTPSSAVADGVSTISVDVIARDGNGVTIAGVPINIILSDDTARAIPSVGTTDANGVFTTKITSNQVGTLGITAQVEDINVSENLNLQFTSASSSKDVTKLVISQFSDNEQLANGLDKVKIQVSALDDQGTPVSNVPIELITSADFPVSFTSLAGVTGEDGIFTTELSSIEIGVVSITAQAPDTTNNLRSETLGVNFNPSNQDAVPATITLTIENNNQPADEAAQIILVAKVLDEKGQPVVGVSVELISNNPALDPADGATNGLGEWRTTLSSAIATSITITAVTTGGSSTKQSTPQTVTFIEIAQATPPASLILNTTATTAAVNDSISLIVSAKDINGAPMENIAVVFEIVSGAGIFQSAATGSTDASGTFTSAISSTDAGLVEVRATAANRSITSNSVSLTFENASDTQVPVASLTLFTDSQTLDSEGNSDGIIISARVKDENNNILVGKSVSFIVDSGDIQPVTRTSSVGAVTYATGDSDGKTDGTGQAYARLTTIGNPNNRFITVTASSETAVATPLQVSVVGTTITIEGRSSIVLDPINPIQNDTVLTISLRDSANNRIANKSLTVSSELGHSLSATQVTTNSNGQATVTITPDPTKIGTDTITVEKIQEDATETVISASHQLDISNENFTLTYNGTVSSSGIIEIPIGNTTSGNTGSGGSGLPCVNTTDPNCDAGTGTTIDTSSSQTFTIRWLQGSVPKTGEHVTISPTRGVVNSLIPADGILDENGEVSFKINSDSVGQAVVTAYADAGPSASITIEFVAVAADQIELQSSRPVLNPNTSSNNNAEQSEIIATVWDINNNLVKNKVIDFNLSDVSGGRLTQSRAVTDSNGQASTIYIAGFNSSAADGIVITATVVGDNITSTTTLTVAQRDLFINIGSGNTLLDEDGIRYETLHTVLVTDSNGTPVNGAEVTLSIYPTRFVGYNSDTDGIFQPILCKNEDINRNGILDAGEDVNSNGRLDPGNVITFNTQTENTLTLVTGGTETDTNVPNGYADFRVIYAVSYATYVSAEITAQATVAGTEEASVLVDFNAVCSKADSDAETCPIQNSFINIGTCLLAD